MASRGFCKAKPTGFLNDLLAEETQQTKKATKKQKEKKGREKEKRKKLKENRKSWKKRKPRKKRKEDMIKAKIKKNKKRNAGVKRSIEKTERGAAAIVALEKAQREKEEQARLEMEIQKEMLRKKKLAEKKERMRVQEKEHMQRQLKQKQNTGMISLNSQNIKIHDDWNGMNRQQNQNQHYEKATSQQNARRAYSKKNNRAVQSKPHGSRAFEVPRNKMDGSKDNMALDQQRYQHHGDLRAATACSST